MRRLTILALGAAASAASLGLVLAQDNSPPPPPGYVPGVGFAAPGADAIRPGDAPAPVVTLPGGPPPEEESAPPPELAEQSVEPAEPAPPPVKKGEPMKRPRYGSAILQAIDKVTAETLRFEAKLGEPLRYRGLVLTVHACEATASDEGFSDSFAHLDIQVQPEALTRQPARAVFRGWMFASSPGLHPVEHPLYDVWLIACKAPAPRPAVASL